MTKTIIIALLSTVLSYPAFADTSMDINNQKFAVEQKYDNEKNIENHNYDQDMLSARQRYQNDPVKLNDILKELQIKHSKKMNDLNNDEKMEMQKIDEKSNS